MAAAKVLGGPRGSKVAVFGPSLPGVVPAASAQPGTTRFLREDGGWQVPPAMASSALGLAYLSEAAPVVNPASPYTPPAGVADIVADASLTLNLDSTGKSPGWLFRVVNSTAADIVLTEDPQGADTLDGAAANVAITIPAHGAAGALLSSATAWRSVQPGSTVVVTTSQPPAVEKAIDFDYVSDMGSVSDLMAQQPLGIEAITWSA